MNADHMNQGREMNNIELSNYIKDTFKPTARSLSMRKPVFGVGINDANYMQQPAVQGGRLTCPCYRAWKAILNRCYNEKTHKTSPAYIGVTMSDEWRIFSKFRQWWIGHYIEGYHLDKDIIGNGKKYSKETCIYVPQFINAFVMTGFNSRGDYMIGVNKSKRNGCFIAQSNNPVTGKREFIGHFKTEEEASEAYKKNKALHATSLKPQMDKIDPRIYPSVISIIKRSK